MATAVKRFILRVFNRLYWERIQLQDSLASPPRDFSSKVRWRMKHDRNPVFIELLDKYRVKAYARKKDVKTANTLYVTDRPETIPFDSLLDNYFIKANHGCRWNILCKEHEFYLYKTEVNYREGNDISEYKMEREEVVQQCRSWLKTTYSKREWAYQHIQAMIMVEELLLPRDGGELNDYKLYTFDGIPRIVHILGPTIRRNDENVLFDPDWQPISLPKDKHNQPASFPDKPDCLQELLETARKLGEGLDFVRVDLYDTTEGIVLGEMTVYPDGGRVDTPTFDPDFNRWLGDQWILPKL